MKKILYYSPFIPVAGFVTHALWVIFQYDIYTMNEEAPKCYLPSLIQGVYFSTIIFTSV